MNFISITLPGRYKSQDFKNNLLLNSEAYKGKAPPEARIYNGTPSFGEEKYKWG